MQTHTGKHSFSLLLRWVDAVFGTANNCPKKNNQLSAYKYEMSPEQVQAKTKEVEDSEGDRENASEREQVRERVSLLMLILLFEFLELPWQLLFVVAGFVFGSVK